MHLSRVLVRRTCSSGTIAPSDQASDLVTEVRSEPVNRRRSSGMEAPTALLSVRLPMAAIALWLLASGCSESEPCVDGEPGIQFVIQLPVEAGSPPELGVSYANGQVARFDDQVPSAPWPDPLVIRVRYGDNAVAGPATAIFSARPDPPRNATADFVADPGECVVVDMILAVVAQP